MIYLAQYLARRKIGSISNLLGYSELSAFWITQFHPWSYLPISSIYALPHVSHSCTPLFLNSFLTCIHNPWIFHTDTTMSIFFKKWKTTPKQTQKGESCLFHETQKKLVLNGLLISCENSVKILFHVCSISKYLF